MMATERTQRGDGLHKGAHVRRAPAPRCHQPVRQEASSQAHRCRCLQQLKTTVQGFLVEYSTTDP